MPLFLSELQGWLAFLQRSPVLLQLLLVGGLLLALLRLRRTRPRRRWQRFWTLPMVVPLLVGQALIWLGLVGLGQRAGLVLLLGQFSLAWGLLQLVEKQVMARWLPRQWHELGISRLLRPLYLIAVVTILLDALGSLQDLAAVPLGVWFGGAITLGNLASVLLVLYLLLVGLPLPAAGISLLVQRSLDLSEGSRRALEQILRYLIFTLGVIWAMARLGFNQTGVLAIAGGLSVGLGFGIKEVFSNIVSGLWLLIEGSVRPGEVLMHDGQVCEVRRLGPRATTLWRGSDNAELVVPNQTFFVTATTTYTGTDRMRRCSLPLGVGRSHSPEAILALLPPIAATHPAVLAAPAPMARLIEFGSERYGYNLEFSINDPLKAEVVMAELRLAICQRFQELGMDPPS
ncbi:MAG: mechanosensitive ion channel family protein [Cyanobacteriota bacterium]